MLEMFQRTRHTSAHLLVLSTNTTILGTSSCNNITSLHILSWLHPSPINSSPFLYICSLVLEVSRYHMINAAKLYIPLHWGSPRFPTVPEWLNRIDKIPEVEELIHIARDSPSKFSQIWACWTHFCSTERYLTLMGVSNPDPPNS